VYISRSGSGVFPKFYFPFVLSDLCAVCQRHSVIHILLLNINVTASFNQLFHYGSMPVMGRDTPNHLCMKINVTASLNQLLRDDSMPWMGRRVERRDPILLLNINVTATFN
jgi:hypothetical protein